MEEHWLYTVYTDWLSRLLGHLYEQPAEMATPEHYRNGVPVVKILTGTPFRTVPAQFHQDVPYNPSLHHPSHSTILKL